MAYKASRNLPAERANSLGHQGVIETPQVQRFFSKVRLAQIQKKPLLKTYPFQRGKAVVDDSCVIQTIDGSCQTVPFRDTPQSPAAFSILKCGRNSFDLDTYRKLKEVRILGRKGIDDLKNGAVVQMALPEIGCESRNSGGLAEFWRYQAYTAMAETQFEGESLLDILKRLMFCRYRTVVDAGFVQRLQRCPNSHCRYGPFTFRFHDPDKKICSECRSTVFVTDCLGLHRGVTEERGASDVNRQFMLVVENLLLAAELFAAQRTGERSPAVIVKDGPLATFGLARHMSNQLRDLLEYLGPTVRLIGQEKTGEVVDHAQAIAPLMDRCSYSIVSPGYLRRHTDWRSDGRKTHYGQTIIVRGGGDDCYVFTLPFRGNPETVTPSEIPHVGTLLPLMMELRNVMHENALTPILLANRLVSLSRYPSEEIFSVAARDRMRTTKSD